jgi:glucose-6-phosphate 1-dehydrogenase
VISTIPASFVRPLASVAHFSSDMGMATTTALNPCLILIFGASGDLTKRKLIPALFDLYVSKQLPEQFAILGVSRTEMTDEAFREKVEPFLKKFAADYSEDKWRAFGKRVHYHSADSTVSDDFPGLKTRMAELRQQHNVGENVLFYLSLAPQLYDDTIINLGSHNMITEGKAWCSINRNTRPWQRIVIEKPFGRDIDSAAHLNRVLGRVFEEESIYRIDHYLGKETVQNLLVFRFANTIFEPIWNRNYIDHVQVTAAETVGVEGRGGYYDSPSGGAMRDMVQSHLMQVMALVAMEPPVTMKADDIRVEKTKVFNATRPPREQDIDRVAVRGQYGAGQVNGSPLVGYRQEKGVAPASQTETYAAVQMFVDTWRWSGVPFYLRSGKAMSRKLTEIVISFKQTPHRLFHDVKRGSNGSSRPQNQIVINVQPDEGIHLRFEGKVPGGGMNIKSVLMDFDYAEAFQAEPPEAYATLLLDAIRGDQTLYKHRDEIEGSWRACQPIIDYWQNNPLDHYPTYAAGTWGPSDADIMMARDNRHWHNP